MRNPALFITIFLFSILVSFTVYSIFRGFGPLSKKLRDPFDND
uniref:Photosystem II protein N n=1 Tax=Callipsygma wilsonis TaxID=2320807 RepID=A0A386B021_9CHLO|nr:photosystem II protein N [Callipsygma wilsonis]AYC65040.1 photosystem II protein N [Callipsygma wilsonis]